MHLPKFAKVVALTGAVVVAVGVFLGLALNAALAQPTGGGATPPSPTPVAPEVERLRAQTNQVFAISIAVVISLSCLAAGYAVGKVGSAAMGAASEKPEIIGRALLFVALAEGIAIYGLLISFLVLPR